VSLESDTIHTAIHLSLSEDGLDLVGNGLVNGLVEESKEIGSTAFWPTNSLFVEFDQYFLDFNPKQDAIAKQTLDHQRADLEASKRQVEAAQANVVRIIRSLEEEGQIMIRRGEEDEFIG